MVKRGKWPYEIILLVFPSGVTVCIEVSICCYPLAMASRLRQGIIVLGRLTIIATGEDGKFHFWHIGICCRGSFRSSYWTLYVRITDGELVVVRSERLQSFSLHLMFLSR